MKAAVLEDVGTIVVRDMPEPELKQGEVLVRVAFCGICTLEQRLYSGEMKIFYPIVPGHEVAGIVEKIAPGTITGLEPGDRVAVDMVHRCHECYFCRTGQSNLCENRFSGEVKPLGGFSEYIAVHTTQVHSVGRDISLAEAAFAEPVACCIRSLYKLQVSLAEDVLVIGAGPMGILHMQIAKAMGARVFVSDIDNGRLALAKELGADGILNPAETDVAAAVTELTGGRGADACALTSPAFPALENAFTAIRKNGRINIYTAYVKEPPSLPVDMNVLHRSQILVTGTEGRTETDFQQAVRLLSFGRVKVDRLISRITGFDELEEGILYAMSPETQRVLLATTAGLREMGKKG